MAVYSQKSFLNILKAATVLFLLSGIAQADCLSKYAKLMENEKSEEKIYALDQQFVACKKREKLDPSAYVGNSVTGAATKDVPGLGAILRSEQLVMTRTESSCNNGKCLATAYITRATFPKHRPGDTGAFCGAMASWQASEKGKRRWEPASGLASWVSQGNYAVAMQIIDDKNRTFCR